ncbi:MAG: hypothetical protein ACWGOD_04325, partial [Desulfobulbales bacterium]
TFSSDGSRFASQVLSIINDRKIGQLIGEVIASSEQFISQLKQRRQFSTYRNRPLPSLQMFWHGSLPDAEITVRTTLITYPE